MSWSLNRPWFLLRPEPRALPWAEEGRPVGPKSKSPCPPPCGAGGPGEGPKARASSARGTAPGSGPWFPPRRLGPWFPPCRFDRGVRHIGWVRASAVLVGRGVRRAGGPPRRWSAAPSWPAEPHRFHPTGVFHLRPNPGRCPGLREPGLSALPPTRNKNPPPTASSHTATPTPEAASTTR